MSPLESMRLIFGGLRAAGLGLLLLPYIAHAGDPMLTPQDLVERSIAYHDPKGAWTRGGVHLTRHTVYSDALAEIRGKSESTAEIWLSPTTQTFRYIETSAGQVIEYRIESEDRSVRLNGSEEISQEDRERLRIRTPELYRDYCEYVYGLPMKLMDPGTRLGSTVEQTTFVDRDALALRVTYDPEVGNDIWYFYFDPQTLALIGSRFHHDETQNDGEYIVYEGEVYDPASGLRLPRSHDWYYNSDDGHLATDTITSLRVELRDPQ